MLDSSPVALPPVAPPRPLKRSASTASLASLPTPPRTHRKHTRGQSRGSCDSDTESDNDGGAGADGDVTIQAAGERLGEWMKERQGRRGKVMVESSDEEEEVEKTEKNRFKRRRTGELNLKASDEDAFWLEDAHQPKMVEKDAGRVKGGTSASTSGSASASRSNAPLLYRKRAQAQALSKGQLLSQSSSQAPVSPPPSNRKLNFPALSLKTPPGANAGGSPPRTPRTRSETRRAESSVSPNFMDSPSNPFLDTPVFDAVDEDEGGEKKLTTGKKNMALSRNKNSAETRYAEKPMMSYVFRGVRRTYPNPMWNHAENRPRSPPPQSQLPMDHPEYSPSVHLTPRLLFPEARRAKAQMQQQQMQVKKGSSSLFKGKGRVGLMDSDDDDDEEEEEDADEERIQPMKLDFGKSATKTTTTTTTTTRPTTTAQRVVVRSSTTAATASQKTTTTNAVPASHKKKVTTLDQEFREVGERLSL